MKNLLLLLILCVSFKSYATNYYVSTSGNDANSGTSIATPWKTIAKVATINFVPGDIISFKRGETFVGSLFIKTSGTAANPITINSYGTGAKALITGFVTVTAWTNLGGGIYESSSAVSTRATCNMVVINGNNTAMGRTPNYPSYYIWDTRVGNTSITSSFLNSSIINWSGAEMAFFTATYRVNRHPITSQSGSTITYSTNGNTDGSFQTPQSFFTQNFLIENDIRTLDVQNEWYYNATTKKIDIFSSSLPTSVQVATQDTLMYTGTNHHYIYIDSLQFSGCNSDAILLGASTHTRITHCDFTFIGGDAVYGGFAGNGTGCEISNCTITNSNNCGIDLSRNYTSATITNNTIRNMGLLIGMGKPATSNQMATGISAGAYNSVVTGNIIDSTGYVGIRWNGSNMDIGYNYVTHYCAGNGIKDGGGIYTARATVDSMYSNSRVHHNIVGNGTAVSQALYFDNSANGFEADHNTAYSSQRGAYIHAVFNANLHDNLFYDADYAYLMTNLAGTPAPSNVFMKHNICAAKTASQFAAYFDPVDSIFRSTTVAVADSNYYIRPISDNTTIQSKLGGVITNKNLAMWKTMLASQNPGTPQDQHSNLSPRAITNTNQLVLYINPTDHDSTITISPGIWVNAANTPYSGTTVLHTFEGLLLINTGTTNTAPTANAGIDQTIQLPTSSVSLVGSGSDPDGPIASYAWSKSSGPIGGTITSPSSASTTVTGLTAGSYQFKLTVTDGLGATGTDIMNVTVNPANVAPTANAGTDKAVQTPTSSVSLVGSGSDADGSISIYAWTRISGPNTPTITTPSASSTTVTGLVVGTYVFRLTVTDNQGATGFDEMSVVVSASANVAPTANAGIDQTIQLPTNSVSLAGSGNDPDGTIASYAWTKVAGGAATITSPTSASTSVTGLSAGNYQFKLTVTDNGGLTGSDNIVITVNPANQAPLVNAGTNQTITSPTSSVTLSGSATDPDGTIASHVWTKTSGTGGTITTNSNYSTTVTGLSVGTYVFRLTATDNQALTGFAEVTITVNSAINVNPSANAGIDQTITWPTNSVSVSGGGTDTDGTIVAYSWTKVSGGSATITDATAAATTITGLGVGVYQFQLQVTDNSGGTGTDNIQITVNQGTATVSYTSLSKIYNGAPQGPTIVTNPVGLPTNTLFNGVGGLKTNVGSWTATTAITDPNYTSTPVTGTFTITPAAATITVTNKVQQYDSTLKNVTVTTSPIGLSTSITGAPQRYKNVYAISVSMTDPNYSATTVNTTLTITAGTTTVSWSPANLTYPTATGAGQTNATSPKDGVFTYLPPSGTVLNAGTQTLRVDFVPTDTNLAPITGTLRNIVVSKGADVMVATDTTQFFDGNPKPITVTTTHGGAVTVLYNGSATVPSAVGNYPFTASYLDANWQATTITGTLHIVSNAGSIFITNFANRVYTGSPISPTVTTPYTYIIRFNGSATVPTNVGSYTVIATISDGGAHTGADTVTMTIIKANPPYTWPAISSISTTTALSGTQLNVTSTIPVAVTYNPASGTLLGAGTQVLSATITPTDVANYNVITVTNTVVVTAASATLSLSNLAQTYNALPKPVTATVSPAVSGVTVTYNGSSIVPTNAGSYAINVTLVNANYTATPVTGTLVIAKANAVLTWATPQPVQDGSSLSATQLNASSNIAGTFSYIPVDGAMLHAGLAALQATFTPTDTTNYNTTSITVYLIVYGSPFSNFFLSPTYLKDNE